MAGQAPTQGSGSAVHEMSESDVASDGVETGFSTRSACRIIGGRGAVSQWLVSLTRPWTARGIMVSLY